MSEMAQQLKLREFSVEEYHRLAEAGILAPDERVELLAGAIVEMSPIGVDHWVRHGDIVAYLVRLLGSAAFVAGQASLELGKRDEPQPDIAVLAPRRYERPNPLPKTDEIFAVIELSDSSLAKDLAPKLTVYARHAIADYVVVDMKANVLMHHSRPNGLRYDRCDRLTPDDDFTLTALPAIRLSASSFLARP
jgi:Uma2 family endonuclease